MLDSHTGTQPVDLHTVGSLTKCGRQHTRKMASLLAGVGKQHHPLRVLWWRRLCATGSASNSSSSSTYAPSQEEKQKRVPKRVALEVASFVVAMREFHRQHQHFVVPYNFEIPPAAKTSHIREREDEWPADLRGVKLGRQMRRFVKALHDNENNCASHHADLLQQLREMGFPIDADWEQFRWQQVALSALQTFKEVEGHLRVPRKFVVPKKDDRWSRPAWGYRLGAHVNFLRDKRDELQDYQLDALEGIGFVWRVVDDKWENLFMPALRTFHEVNGHTDVPQKFVVPTDAATWPRELWGFKLGRMVNLIRSDEGLYVQQVERFTPELESLGFSYSSIEFTWNEKILPSLEAFRAVYGHCHVDRFFVVPREDPWPRHAWGMKLGFTVNNIRSRGDFFELVGRDMERLEKLGFVWNTSEAKWRQRILPSLRTFVAVFGHATIDRNFVVPAEPPWPVNTWGTKLGKVATDASYQQKYADYIEIERNQLESLGFFWSVIQDEDDGQGSDSG